MTENMTGADYSAGRPGGAALAAAGVKAVGRYASYGRSSINISADEVKDLRSHGIDIFVYNEHSAGYMNGGATAAQTYVPGALSVCRDAGLPDGPIFYAVDYDATLGGAPTSATALGNMHALAAFLTEAAKISKSWDLVGVYGGYYVIQWLLDNLPNLTHAVQTSAWSAGRWDPRAFARQDGYNWTINGVNCDHLTIVNPDDGSLRYRGGDVPLTDAEWTKLRGIVNAEVKNAIGYDPPWVSTGLSPNAGKLTPLQMIERVVPEILTTKLPNGSATVLTALQAVVNQTDSLEASQSAQSTALGKLDPNALADALAQKLLSGGLQVQGVDYAHIRQLLGDGLNEHLASLRIVTDTPAPTG
jgi:hypothetical protein